MPKNKNIEITNFKNFRWYNIKDIKPKDIKFLKENFSFNKINIDNCLPPLQRPKILKYPEYIFMILLFPYYDKKSREIKITEVDFFISTSYIVTVHQNLLEPLAEISKKYRDPNAAAADFGANPVNLLYDILDSLLGYCFPILNHVGIDIDNIEEKIFSNPQRENIKDILLIKRNIVNFRKAMQAHKNVIRKLIGHSPAFFETRKLATYFENLVEQTKDIWDLLENYKDTIDALHNSNESLVSFRLSEIMKTLTIFSVIVFPLTLFAAVFSMNVQGTPFVDHPLGFWIVMIMMFLGTVGMLVFFKLKKWI